MAKRTRKLNYEKMIKEGKGQGGGEKYKSWLKIQDVPSIGRSTRIKGNVVNRKHDFLSDLERNYFHCLDFADNIIDIREQYPLLPLEETMQIAEELGIEHPKNPKTKELIIMTTDFLVTFKDHFGELQERARTIKYKDELTKKRVLEKFEIERVYFDRKNIDWGIVTEQEINKTLSETIADLYSYRIIKEIDGFNLLEDYMINDLIQVFISKSVDYEGSFITFCYDFDRMYNLKSGNCISLLKHLLINKIIKIDLNKGINLDSHIDIILNSTEIIGGLEAQ